jgi:hypothetical protein
VAGAANQRARHLVLGVNECPKIPPIPRPKGYATFFATQRSLADEPPLMLSSADVTERTSVGMSCGISMLLNLDPDQPRLPAMSSPFRPYAPAVAGARPRADSNELLDCRVHSRPRRLFFPDVYNDDWFYFWTLNRAAAAGPPDRDPSVLRRYPDWSRAGIQ